jgi:hypothetical protein
LAHDDRSQCRPYKHRKHVDTKRAVVSLVERGGKVRSFHAPTADAATVAKIVNENVHAETRLHTDESKLYTKVGANFAAHETVNHSAKEYARGGMLRIDSDCAHSSLSSGAE